ncbi:hypothetical protein IEN85_08925 [Pelagicoccus sp. NFK12]|uniref:Uncharacterized protein n=1 Tax=Pelagicoccus enzymogenes TaxID=2773457 RepID=A0A927F7D9_9BACT|nr:hypothetical protein [Pelagicoccus enzymogenes]MBD5779617.1 hypothetical protein [Pelagicoccus enzymogenes]
MKVITRTLQALAVLGAIAAGVFYFLAKNEYQSLDTNLQSLNASLKAERTRVQKLQKENAAQAETLAAQADEIQKLTADSLLANNQLLQIQRENKRLADERDAQEIAERRLQKENSRLTQEVNVLKATSVPQEEIANYELAIANLERQVLELQQTQPLQQVSSILPSSIPADPSLRGNVLTVGKGASFVVLDIGYSDGVRLQNELYVQHADTPIAKIQVTEVKENLSIARVLPESLVKTPQTGDSVSSLN